MKAMQREWKIGGVYATFTMTVTIEPADYEDPADHPAPGAPLPSPDFTALASHFRAVVDQAESFRQMELT